MPTKKRRKNVKKSVQRVARTRNAGTWTEARYWSQVRSSFRHGFRWWKPGQNALIKARRKYSGHKNSQKWEYICADCTGKFPRTKVEVDHIKPAGSLRNYEDVVPFLKALTAEEGYQVLCTECHKVKTAKEREARR